MSAEKMKITELNEAQLMLPHHIPLEWCLDPAVLRRIPDEIVHKIVKIRLNFLAEHAALAAQAIELQGKMFHQMAKVIK